MLTPEQQAVLRAIRKLADFWQITSDDLGGLGEVSPRPAAPVAPEPLLPKYRHPRTGETWDGEGTQPPWLREALTKQGYTVEELKFDSPLNKQETHCP
jgi:DNA-binding protein H-NS